MVKTRVGYDANPNGNIWLKDTTGFGQKMLAKMGWKEGQGLGRTEQGIKSAIRVSRKRDHRGVGCSRQWAEEGSAQMDAFSAVLADLNKQHHSPAAMVEEDTSSNPEQSLGLEECSRRSRNRLHYAKFTRGKDLSRCSEQALLSIMGPRGVPQTKKEKEEEEAEEKKAHDSGLRHVQSSLSTAEYFAQKMEAMRARLKTSASAPNLCEMREQEEEEEEEEEEKEEDLPRPTFHLGGDELEDGEISQLTPAASENSADDEEERRRKRKEERKKQRKQREAEREEQEQVCANQEDSVLESESKEDRRKRRKEEKRKRREARREAKEMEEAGEYEEDSEQDITTGENERVKISFSVQDDEDEASKKEKKKKKKRKTREESNDDSDVDTSKKRKKQTSTTTITKEEVGECEEDSKQDGTSGENERVGISLDVQDDVEGGSRKEKKKKKRKRKRKTREESSDDSDVDTSKKRKKQPSTTTITKEESGECEEGSKQDGTSGENERVGISLDVQDDVEGGLKEKKEETKEESSDDSEVDISRRQKTKPSTATMTEEEAAAYAAENEEIMQYLEWSSFSSSNLGLVVGYKHYYAY